jgi:excinuclease UvrABC nuclease subunit
MSRWLSYDLMHPDRIILNPMPTAPGVYAIHYDGRLVYIGSSVDVRNRFFLHNFRHSYARSIHTPWDDLPPETVITVKFKRSLRWGDWLMWEMRLIRKLQPPFNRQYTGRKVKRIRM